MIRLSKLQRTLNIIAQESFRDRADLDYVTARHCWRMRFREQFLWSALQAHEKYLKGILLFNGQKAPAVHNLRPLLIEVRKITDVPLTLPPWIDQFYRQLSEFGTNRYYTRETYTMHDFHQKLDESVWCVRRYCQYVRAVYDLPTGKVIELLPDNLRRIERTANSKYPTRYKPFNIFNGELENILERPANDSGRQALVWQNQFYGGRVRHSVTYTTWSSNGVPVLARSWAKDQALRAELRKYIKFEPD